MKPLWQGLAWAGGVLGAAVTGAAVGTATRAARAGRQVAEQDEQPLGLLEPDRRSTVTADDGLPLAVQEVEPADGGAAELTIVLVHGFANDSRSWHFQREVLPELSAPRVRLLLYDQRSHGRSGRSSKAHSTIEQLGRDLDAVLRATCDGPVVLVGHSMGGMAVLALAEQRPELFGDPVRGVALIGTSASGVGVAGPARAWLSPYNPVTKGLGVLAGWQPGLVERARRTGDGLSWNITRAVSFEDRDVGTALVDLVDRMIRDTTVGVATDFLETLGTHNRAEALPSLRRCEVLVVCGDADRLIPLSHAELIAEKLPEARVVRVRSAGHMVMLECHELVTERLGELIRRVHRQSGKARA